ncbi:MAG: right-handed parallel beta-helix repeat-containing protein [Phycisphaerae bacterium]|nr:right-handed parallel beta-helix repeat-containing protein [Phycisphaerae bacterium]
MISLQQILSNPIVQRIGFAIMHSLWQCTAIAILLAGVLLALRNRRTQVRHNAAVSALLLMVIASVVTVFVAGGGQKVAPVVAADGSLARIPDGSITSVEMPVLVGDAVPPVVETVLAPVVLTKNAPAANAAGIVDKIEIAAPYLAIAWVIGVLILSVWHLGGWAQLRRLRIVMVKPVEDHVSQKLARLARSLAVTRTIEIVESALVSVPTVIGAFKPVVLLPASALTGLSADQLEMILAHELAHIKRNDYLMNLIQTAIDILLFYHPAAWYVSRKIRAERENCCDDIAVKITGDSLKYARALTTLEEIKATNRRLAVAATGGNFFDRIARLVGKEDTRKTKPAWQTAAITMLVIFAAVVPLCFAMSAKSSLPLNSESVLDNQRYLPLVCGDGELILAGKKINSLEDLYFALAEIKERPEKTLQVTLSDPGMKADDVERTKIVLMTWARVLKFKEVVFTGDPTFKVSLSSDNSKDPANQVRHYVRLVGSDKDGLVFEGKRYEVLSELDEPLSKLANKSSTVLEWAFAPGEMPKEKNSMVGLGIAIFITDMERMVAKHDLAGLCYAGQLPVGSKGATFSAGVTRSFAMDKKINLDMQSGPIELQSIKFTKDAKRKGSAYKALIDANVISWPKTKLEIRIELRTGNPEENAVIYKTFENSGTIKGAPIERGQVIEVPFFEGIDNDVIEDVKHVEVRVREITSPSNPKLLQELIDDAKPESTLIVPRGTYTDPVKITKPLTLKAEANGECIIEVTANEPAIFIDTASKGDVTVEGLTIKWKLASSDRIDYASAVAVKDCKATIKDCVFAPLGNFRQSPTAARAYGFSKMYLDNCKFDGFDYTVCFSEATEGAMTNCAITKCKSQGIILYSGASADVIGNYIANSGKHAVRSTGGKLNMLDNLIVNNANRGVYLGNRTGSGRIANNVLIGNGVGISGFASANVIVENNVILKSQYAAIAMRGSCKLKIKDNIIQDNPTGVIVYSDNGENNNKLLQNTFYNNKDNAKDIKAPANTITTDPLFKDVENGDFSLKPGKAQQNKQGLTDHSKIGKLWQLYKDIK